MLSDQLRFRDVRSTSSFRLTLLLGTLFLAGVIAMLGLIYLLTTRELTARSDRILYEKANSLLLTPVDQLPARIRAEITNGASGFSYFALIDRDGGMVVGNVRVSQLGPIARPFNAPEHPDRHGPLRMLLVQTPQHETIVLGRDISQIYSLRERLLQILIGSGVASLIGVFIVAVLLSIKPLRRVRDLQQASHAIAEGQLETRMPIAGRNDELDQFAATLNHMIEQVARVIAEVKSATDAIAHDLRTPLTRVRARVHQLKEQSVLPGERDAMLEEMTVDLDVLLDRFAALLRISELEASARRSNLADIDVTPLIAEVADLYGPLSEERGIILHVEPSSHFIVKGDRELLFEAIGNLTDNAIKFAVSKVILRGASIEGHVLIEIADDGPGIATEDREAVLRRFYRLPSAAGVPGSGLGLSVVNAIMHVHGFVLEFASGEPGLIARIRA